MKKTFLYLGVAVLSLVVTTAIVGGVTYASQGKLMSWRGHDPEQRAIMMEKREAVNEAIANNNYQAWVEAVGENCPFNEQVNEDNFVKFAEAQQLMKSGDSENAQAIMDELGLEKPMGPRSGEGKMFMKNFDPEKIAAMKTALENNDYDAWLEVVGADSPMAEKINTDNFAKYAEAQKLIQAGDRAGGQAIMTELGLNNHWGNKFGGRCRGGDCSMPEPRPESVQE